MNVKILREKTEMLIGYLSMAQSANDAYRESLNAVSGELSINKSALNKFVRARIKDKESAAKEEATELLDLIDVHNHQLEFSMADRVYELSNNIAE